MLESTLGVGIIGVNAVRGWAATAHIPALRAPARAACAAATLWADRCSRTHNSGRWASAWGSTRERIRQIEVKALRKLRDPSRSEKLKDLWR
jgi:hypothetical protein